MKPTDLLAIGDLAKRTGLAVSAIRYYEEQGLVTSLRSAGGQRRFLRSDIRRLSFVRIAQELGFPLSAIRKQLQTLPDGRTPTRKDWTRISKAFRADIDARIAALERLRGNLDGCIACGCLSLRRCALYNPQDVARNEGPGPRRLMPPGVQT
ncbi:MAG: redox-sensitive transcriptional activator SoxR [Paracoccaceae bacterium]